MIADTRKHKETRVRILIANHQLASRAGSELASIELGRELTHRGHSVALFTLRPGPLAAEVSRTDEFAVFTPATAQALRQWRPEMLHAHHWPTLLALEDLHISIPWVIGFLGVLPPLENPPPALGTDSVAWWAISEEVRHNVGSIPGWSPDTGVLIRNWFVESDPTRPSVPPTAPISRVLIVSNHFPARLHASLLTTGLDLGISVDRVGLPGRSVDIDDKLLGRYDALVTLGRTAIAGIALGLPVLIADHCGADGWVTPESLAEIAARNFSGRAFGKSATTEDFHSWMSSPPIHSERVALQDWAFANCRISTAVDRLLELYQSPNTDPPSRVFGRWTGVLNDYLSGSSESAPAVISSSRATPIRDGVTPPPVVLHFFDWFAQGAWKEEEFVDPFDWSLLGDGRPEVGSLEFYERQFRYIRSAGVDAIAWEYIDAGGNVSTPPSNALAALQNTGLKILPMFDLEFTTKVRRAGEVLATIEVEPYLQPSAEGAESIVESLRKFFAATPTHLRFHDADGCPSVFLFAFGWVREAGDRIAWRSFADAIEGGLTQLIGPRFRLYWTATNAPFEEYLFAHHFDHHRPWHFVLDMPQSQFGRSAVTVNYYFDNRPAAVRDGLQRAIRADSRYLRSSLWLARNADPTVIFIYGWNEPFEGSYLFPSRDWGKSRHRLTSWFTDALSSPSAEKLPPALIVIDDLWHGEQAPRSWHETILRQMIHYRFRLFLPQADVRLASSVSQADLEGYSLIIDASLDKPPTWLGILLKLIDGPQRSLIMDPKGRLPAELSGRFLNSYHRVEVNGEVPLIEGGTVFVRDDTRAGQLSTGAQGALYCALPAPDADTHDPVPLIIESGHMILVNSLSNDDRLMTEAFARLYGRAMHQSILYGEGLMTQRLEQEVDGRFTKNRLSRGSVIGLETLPSWYPANVVPRDVPTELQAFALGQEE